MKKHEINLTGEDFLFLEKILLEWGYDEFTKNDSYKTFLRLNLSPPRHIIGREVTFVLPTMNGYTVVLHTTYLKNEGRWRSIGTDAAWNLISERDKPKYFAKPFSRTKGFVMKFLRYAWVSKWKVEHRPFCPKCHAYMDIHKKINEETGSHQYFWICRANATHPNKPVFLSWDFGLPPLATRFVKIRREYTRMYRAKNKKEGKVVTPAPIIRKIWTIGKPENRK